MVFFFQKKSSIYKRNAENFWEYFVFKLWGKINRNVQTRHHDGVLKKRLICRGGGGGGGDAVMLESSPTYSTSEQNFSVNLLLSTLPAKIVLRS